MKRRNSELYTALHPALHMENVYRSYVVKGEKHNVLSNLSFDIYPGEVVCLLGPNGAGKTTTVKIASTLLLPDLGTVEICGIDGIKHPRRACDHLSLLLGGRMASIYVPPQKIICFSLLKYLMLPYRNRRSSLMLP